MLAMKNTENLTGVTISGDFNDLNRLVDAFHEITIDDSSEKYSRYIDMSSRVLGICYDIRHAMQGDRAVQLVENGMDEDKMKFHSVIAPTYNVYYQCNCLYPELFFATLALNKLIIIRMRDLVKSRYVYNDALDKNAIWDETIAVIRVFQAEFMKCVRELLSEAAFSRWLKLMNNDYINIEDIAGQYVDLHNIKYINMNREQRLKNFSKVAKRIAEFSMDTEHREIKKVAAQAAKDYGCSESEIRLQGIEYPEEIVW